MRISMILTTTAIALIAATSVLANDVTSITQSGTSQTVTTDQSFGLNGSISIGQTGYNNAMLITQQDADTIDRGAGNYANTASITQAGHDNTINTTAPLFLTATGQNNNYANGTLTNSTLVNQKGDHNRLVYEQTGDGHALQIDQKGSGNSAEIGQEGNFNDTATLAQSGTNNTFEALQTAFGDQITSTQSGTTNLTSISQRASSQFAGTTQSGADNQLLIGQYSVGASANVIQSGVGNHISVVQ